MDDGDAAHEAVGALGTGLHTGAAMEFGGRRNSSAGDWSDLPWDLCGVSADHDLVDWRLGVETDGTLEKTAAHFCVGCHGVRDLALDVWTQEHPLAQRRLPDSRRDARAGRSASRAQFLATLAGCIHSWPA